MDIPGRWPGTWKYIDLHICLLQSPGSFALILVRWSPNLPDKEGSALRASLDCPKSPVGHHSCHFLASTFSSCGNNSVVTAHSHLWVGNGTEREWGAVTGRVRECWETISSGLDSTSWEDEELLMPSWNSTSLKCWLWVQRLGPLKMEEWSWEDRG